MVGGRDFTLSLLKETFLKIADILQLAVPTKSGFVDSTLLVDLYDMEAARGNTSGGKFKNLKLHAFVNQFVLLLLELVTP